MADRLTRREVLQAGTGALVGLLAACSQQQASKTPAPSPAAQSTGQAAAGTPAVSGEPRFDGVTLKYMSHPGQIHPIITHHLDYLKEKYGISIQIIDSSDPTSYQDAMRDIRAGGGQFDIYMIFPRYNGELAAAGGIRELDDLIQKYNAKPLWDNIMDAYRILYSEWHGKIITAPVDGDVAMMYYRKDAFENPDYQKKFKEKYGFDLRVPRTWEECLKIAEFFTGWAWGPTGKPGYGFQTSTWDRAFIEQQWAPMMASAGGNWLTEDLDPGWNNDAGTRALIDLKHFLDFAPPGSISLSWNQTMETVFADDVAIILWYMDLGRLGWSPNSWFAKSGGPEKMKNIGYAEWPGYEINGKYRNYNSMFYGRVVAISKFSKNPDAAFMVLKTLLTPERRVLSMDDDQSGSDMFLKTDYDPSVFKKLTPTKEFLDVAKVVITKGFPEMQIPGVGEYMDALQGQIHAYLTGSESDPKKALQAAAERWKEITDRYNRSKQKEYWLEVLERYRKAGLQV
jgi:multiple sugar transport system substrate-binding protein